ncbi:hypothetical protein ACFFP0_24250 [Rhizobium puerariae]|uniref:Uncharacterized protein n=1 Tax=Rhizobium puerariae TaxID=1585791 RepID=A0ABV6AN54_9HYPH
MTKTAFKTAPADNCEPSAVELSLRLDKGLSLLKWDIDALAWGCEELWHHAFSRDKDNEQLSRVPVIILNLIAEKLGPLATDAERLESLISKGHRHG